MRASLCTQSRCVFFHATALHIDHAATGFLVLLLPLLPMWLLIMMGGGAGGRSVRVRVRLYIMRYCYVAHKHFVVPTPVDGVVVVVVIIGASNNLSHSIKEENHTVALSFHAGVH